MTYIEGTDSVGPPLRPPLPRPGPLRRAGRAAAEVRPARWSRCTGYADRILGEYMAGAWTRTPRWSSSPTTASQLGALQDDPSKTRDMRRVSEKFHREEGILYLYGREREADGRLDGAELVDVAPTILALGGLPPAARHAGPRADRGAVDSRCPGRRWPATRRAAPRTRRGRRRHRGRPGRSWSGCKSLGYVGDAPPAAAHRRGGRRRDQPALAPGRAQPRRHALRAGQVPGGRRRPTASWSSRNPSDAALRTSLAGALGALGRYDEALEELDAAIKLEPLNVEAYHNRGAVLRAAGQARAGRQGVPHGRALQPAVRAVAPGARRASPAPPT